MSRDYIDNPPEASAFALRGIENALERLADTLDDYMDMSLGMAAVAKLADHPRESLDATVALLEGIKARREERAR